MHILFILFNIHAGDVILSRLFFSCTTTLDVIMYVNIFCTAQPKPKLGGAFICNIKFFQDRFLSNLDPT